MAAKFTTVVTMDSDRVWRDYTLQQIKNGELEEVSVIYTIEFKIPSQKNLEENVDLIDDIRKSFCEEIEFHSIKELDNQLIFRFGNPVSYDYIKIDDIYELRHYFEKSLSSVLEKFKVEECSIMFYLSTRESY